MINCIEEYVQVDDFKMYTKKFQGKKLQPVIIMEAGYGDYSKTWDHIAEEFTFSLSEADRYCKSMNDIPLVVLAAGKKAFYSPDAQMKWLQLQEELLRLSSNNKFLIAERSGHHIQKDEPNYVIDAVKWIIG